VLSKLERNMPGLASKMDKSDAQIFLWLSQTFTPRRSLRSRTVLTVRVLRETMENCNGSESRIMAAQNKPSKMKPVARIVLVVVSAALYFGLAILGWGGVRAFFSHAALIALVVATAALVIAAYMAGGNVSPGVREDRGNRWVVGAFAVIGLFSGFFPAYTDRIGFWTIDGEGIRWLGLALYVVGGALRLWPVFVLGNRFSGLVAIQPGHTLVTKGIYGVIRHPSYLGLLTNSLGWGLAFRSGVGILLTVVLIPLLMARIRSEEALLRDEFGAEYEAYRGRTCRLIPGIY
jgi:protein-S-isoprenylcysteine O-methyltransferase Ste14